MRAWIFVSAAVLFVIACASNTERASQDRPALRTVALPDLSRLEESVQRQLREQFTALTAKQNDARTSSIDLAMAFGDMGVLLLAAEFRDAAEASLMNAEALAPGEMRWPFYRGVLYRVKGDIPNAIAAFQQAQRLAPDDAPTLISLGEAALDQGQPDVAGPLFTKALSRDPRSVAALYGLGRTALARKEYAQAAQQLEQALALDTSASVIHYSLAMAYRGLGDQRRAELHLQQRGTMHVRPDPLNKVLDDVLESALTYEKNADGAGNRGEWAEAAEYLKKAVALAPTRASPHHKLGTALFYLRDRDGAREQFRETIRISPTFAAAHYALGVMDEEDREYQRAIDAYSAAIKSEPLHVDAHLGLANALRRSGRPEQSLSEYQRVLAINPGASRARFGYAASLIRMKRYDEASRRLAEAMTLYPNDPAFARAAARLLAAAPDDRVRDGRRALELAQILVTRQPRTIDLVETLAMASAEAGQYGPAVAAQREAITAAERAGRRDLVERLTENLQRYQAGRPCRTPWRADEPLEY